MLFGAQLAGLAAIALAVAVRGQGPAGGAEVLLAIPAAISGTLGIWAYYRGMAVGAMSVVAPIAGVSAIVPVTVGLATGDNPSPAQIFGILVALVGVGLASLYPVVTVVLARVVLGERVDRIQDVGIVAVLAGVVLISAG